MNRYFEDFTAGQTFKHWPGRTITEFDNTWFTLMTMNTNPIHFDAAYAATTQHGRPLVNGLLVMATVVGMSVKDVSENAIANLEYESVRHSGPTFAGDTLYAETTVIETTQSKSKNDRGVIYVETRGLNQRGEEIMTLPAKFSCPAGPSELNTMDQLYFVVHTHWDREWYQPFQQMRARLVAMADRMIPLVERGTIPSFHFDGQTIVIDDYLELRPRAEARLRKLIGAGKIQVGPWYVLADSFL